MVVKLGMRLSSRHLRGDFDVMHWSLESGRSTVFKLLEEASVGFAKISLPDQKKAHRAVYATMMWSKSRDQLFIACLKLN